MERNQWHSVVLVSLMLRSHTHMPTSGLFIIRRTNRAHASSILEMRSLCSHHALAKHLTIKAFFCRVMLIPAFIEILNLILLNIISKFVIQQIYIYNLGDRILELYNVLVQIRLTVSKTKRYI